MSDFLTRVSKLSPQRLALLANELNDRLETLEEDRSAPIAIVGMACRLPGGIHDAESFWKLLSEGTDAIREVPSDRWNIDEFYDSNPDTPGKMATRWGGFVDAPDQFDPKFFGIAPAEAAPMDPQQRLLLETVWEALEHAAIAPSTLAGSQTGVFVGVCNFDYGSLALRTSREGITPYFASGISHAIAAGRISYLLGLEGPSLAVDTSCSASLMAVHLACQSLRRKESHLALAGGANSIITPEVTIALSQSRMMSPDGRCKAFSDDADGFVRAEGSGMIVLKRLRDAMQDGNRILAVIRGTAANQDGRSSGLTAPNGRSQEAVVRAALADAGMGPDDLQYIEAHGTGTALGDPIEIGALGNVFAERSKAAGLLRVGSVKSNLGHLESAAGVAGLMKLVLSLERREIPASLHCHQPNHHIDWNSLPICLSKQKESWPACPGKRAGGVSSFGFSGTNVHVIVEEYLEAADVSDQPEAADERPLLFPLSAKSEAALRSVATRLSSHLGDHGHVPLAGVARTLNSGRSHFDHRLAIAATSQMELRRLLSDFGNLGMADCQTGRVIGRSARVGFLFADHECVHPNLSRDLYNAVPKFRETVNRCEDVLLGVIGHPLTSLLYPGPADSTSAIAKELMPVASFAVQYALAEVWRSCGLVPAIVAGSGTGACIAACFAGVMTVEDALRLLIETGKGNLASADEIAQQISYGEQQIPCLMAEGERDGALPLWLRHALAGPAHQPLPQLNDRSCNAYLTMANRSAFQELTNKLEGKFSAGIVASVQDNIGGLRAFMQAAAGLYVMGCELDLSTFYGKIPARPVSLPTYPFERERYWLDVGESSHSAHASVASSALVVPHSHPPKSSDEWLYQLVWESRPVSAKDPKGYDGNFSPLLDEVVAPQPSEPVLRIGDAGARFDAMCSSYILRALEQLGLKISPDEGFTIGDLCHRYKIAPSRNRLMGRLLSILVEDGILQRENELFRFAPLEQRPDPESEASALQFLRPEIHTELEILKRCTSRLPEVLLGTCDPMQLVFAEGSVHEAEQIYQNSPVCRYFNESVCDTIKRAVGHASGRTVRILEIGAGTGATTASVLPAVSRENVEYTFTDISPVFLSKARDKFKDVPGVSYRLLNIERAPAEQGFEAGGYDIVLAANVLHATADLRKTIAHTRQLLRPGGLLMLLEGVRPDRWLDLTFGLTDGWWRFVDRDLRPEHPLLSCDKWQSIFHEHGMGSSRTIRYKTRDGKPSQQVLMLACADVSAVATRSGAISKRRWVVVSDESGVGASLEKLLRARDEHCDLVPRSEVVGEVELTLQTLRSRWRDEVLEVVYLGGMDTGALADYDRNIQLCAHTPIRLMRSLAQDAGTANLWLVTRGAQATADYAPSETRALQAMLWGAGRAFGLEHPDRYRRLIDLDPDRNTEEIAADLLDELLKEDVEDQIAHRAGQRLFPRLKHASTAIIGGPPSKLRRDGSYLVTGGFGSVGRQVTRWAAEAGAGHLILLGRSGLETNLGDRTRFVEEIRALGAQVTVIAGDVASMDTMESVFSLFGKNCPELRGIFHAATAQSVADITQLSETQITDMLRPKVLGTCLLHQWTRHRNLDFLISFSSTTSLLGSRGMAHYAAANQFMDNFASTRRAQGLPMLSVNWGAWHEVQDAPGNAQAPLRQMGLLSMDSATALGWLPLLTTSSRANIMIADVDWKTLKAIYEARRIRPMLADQGNNPAIPDFQMDDSPLISPIGQDERSKFIKESIISASAKVLGFRAGDVPPVDIPFTDLGLDSLMAVDLRNRLQAVFGRELPPTIVFDYPTISALAEMLETLMWAANNGDKRESYPIQDEIRI